MAIEIVKHPAERFIDWFPHNTKLYIRGERGKDGREVDALYQELFDQLVPFLEEVAERGVDWK